MRIVIGYGIKRTGKGKAAKVVCLYTGDSKSDCRDACRKALDEDKVDKAWFLQNPPAIPVSRGITVNRDVKAEVRASKKFGKLTDKEKSFFKPEELAAWEAEEADAKAAKAEARAQAKAEKEASEAEASEAVQEESPSPDPSPSGGSTPNGSRMG